jgi:hypothetical protein
LKFGKVTEMANAPTDPPGQGPDTAGADTVLILRPYPVRVGQRITIEAGPRRGDWEIIEVGDRRLRLRCPISHKELDCDRFCYVVTEAAGIPWPHHHQSSATSQPV